MDERVPGTRFCLFDAAGLSYVLDEMADKAATLLHDEEDPILLGILRRGAPLAGLLQEQLSRRGLTVPSYTLTLKRYGDDLTLLHTQTALTENAEFAARDLSQATVMVVDDVLYQGHSISRVLAYLSERGVRNVKVAVLVDRCCAQLPVHADIVGVRLQLAPSDVVECNIPPYEPEFKVELLRPRRH